MKKISFLINSMTFGGAQRVLTILCEELKQEYEIEVIFLEKEEFYELPQEVKKVYLSDFNGKESGLKKLLYIPLLAWKLKKYIQQNNIHLIQSHIYRANYVNVIAKLFGGKHKTQLVTAGRISRYKELGIIGKINLFLIKYLYQKADLLVLKSKGMQDDMQKLFDFKVSQIVINNPYNIQYIENLMKEQVNFIFKKDKKYIISVGRLIKLKRNNEIIEVLSKLDKNIELIFLGEGEEKNNLIELSKKLNLENRVHFLGQVKNPYKYIVKSDVFVSCSESEGFPNVLVEAMICETMVISSDCISGPREILGNNEYGLLFEVGDKDTLFKHLNLVLNNEKIKNNYIKKAKKRSFDFSIKRIIEKYKRILDENSDK